jgi:hypothetical protein
LAGECVIDVAEYYSTQNPEKEQVVYYQLKHTIQCKNQPFKLSDLKKTVVGFAERYRKIFIDKEVAPADSVKFIILTNRPISVSLKDTIFAIGKGDTGNTRIVATLLKYTMLQQNELGAFCSKLEFCDGEGDYNAQRHALHEEIANLVADTIDNAKIENIIGLVSDSALPDSNGVIAKEHILQRFGIVSEQDLFPAPAEFDKSKIALLREQQQSIVESVLSHKAPIIHADDGVGKSVITQQLAVALPTGSISITFDCFAAGSYRSTIRVMSTIRVRVQSGSGLVFRQSGSGLVFCSIRQNARPDPDDFRSCDDG